MNLFFDYGDLLFEYSFTRETLKRAHNLVLPEIRQRDPTIEYAHLANAHDRVIQSYLEERRQSSVEWPMQKIMRGVVDDLQLDDADLVQRLEMIYKTHDHDAYPKPGIPSLINELHPQYSLHIISNLPHDSAIQELSNFDLLDRFTTITFSYEAGHRKPHESIYLLAMEKANVEEGIFFSHDIEEVEGAKNVGLDAYLVFFADDIRKVLLH